MTFALTPKQQAAQRVLTSGATHLMLFGGSRSGKTFLLMRNIVARAMKAPRSRHAVFRFAFAHCKASIVQETFPSVMEKAFPGVPVALNRSDWIATLPNGSEIWFGGLDDKERTEKILGKEFATIYLNECSQIPQSSRDLAVTRLAQSCTQEIDGEKAPLPLRMYYDCNPPSKGHWTYKLFVQKVDPDTKLPLARPADYDYFQINPEDNAENLPENYLDTLRGLSARLQKRFLLGEFADATPNALFRDETIDKWRVLDAALPDMVRIVVAVDPSGSGDTDNADNDAIGIAVVGLGTDGNAYVLEDATVKAGPETWGKVATSAFERHEADIVVGETNYGGDMVRMVVQAARPRTPFKKVTASRGKVVRAEPISTLYEQGKVRHVGYFRELEDELCAFSTVGYTGDKSPNRADAAIWALTELFPSVLKGPKVEKKDELDELGRPVRAGAVAMGWMA